MRKFLFSRLAGAVAAGICAVPIPAFAGAPTFVITTGQWYSAFVQQTPGNVVSDGNDFSTDGPLKGGGTGNAVAAGPNDTSGWSIVMPAAGFVTFTDMQNSGEQFQVFVNGNRATAIANAWLNPPGQAGIGTGDTSAPGAATANCGGGNGADIGACLGNSNFSSGTFLLPAGSDTIFANAAAGDGFSYVDFYADTGTGTISEPVSAAILGAGLAGVGLLRRRRRSKQ